MTAANESSPSPVDTSGGQHQPIPGAEARVAGENTRALRMIGAEHWFRSMAVTMRRRARALERLHRDSWLGHEDRMALTTGAQLCRAEASRMVREANTALRLACELGAQR